MTIDASDGQGMQFGSGNTQVNNFGPKAPLDPAALSALSPHVAVSRLRSRPHDELVDFFAAASPDLVREILAAFLATDEGTVVGILADINRRKATELIGALAESEPWLAQLPRAAEAIAGKAATLRWVSTLGIERVRTGDGLSRPREGGRGYVREYRDGQVYWSEKHGTRTVSGAIQAYVARRRTGLPGLPVGDQEDAPRSPSGTSGIRQLFEHGMVYSSERGIYLVHREWLPCYEAEGGSVGWLGFPVAEYKWSYGSIQFFEGGAIHWVTSRQTFAVRSAVAEAMPGGQEFRPISKEEATHSSQGTSGRVQRFVVGLGGGEEHTAVYTSAGAVVVSPQVWPYYRDLGGEASWLGFPSKPAKDQGGVGYQSFEGGIVYWQEKTGPLAVRREVDTLRWQEKLGYPTTEEQSFGAGGADRIQFFDWGVVTRRGGNYEAWHRPRS